MNSDLVVGIHAMVFLHHKKGTISSESLADNICTNPARVRRVMAKLKKAGII
ncbi:Rrf2 family transcriptional regulator [Anaerorhabdus sp.]